MSLGKGCYVVKKIYKSPELVKLNSISSFTKARGNQGIKDGGAGKNHSS